MFAQVLLLLLEQLARPHHLDAKHCVDRTPEDGTPHEQALIHITQRFTKTRCDSPQDRAPVMHRRL